MSPNEPPAPSSPRIGVLIVDDETAIGRLLEVSLALNGFIVWSAASGPEALNLFRRHADDIRLVLLDVQMRECDGPELLTALRSLRPELVCCFMSGSTGAYTGVELIEMGAAQVFRKPFSLIEVVRALRQIMGYSERRGGLRLAVPPIHLTIGGQQAQMRDRSAGGLRLWSPQPMAVGSVFRLQFVEGVESECSVEVMRCQWDGDGWAVGCRFVV